MPESGTFLHMKTPIFVVEGVHDEMHLKSLYPNIQTISVGGSAVIKDTIEFLKSYQDTFDIVLLLDPDFPGNKIRNKIEQEIPKVKHVFVDSNKAKYKKKVGIEHMKKEDLDEALKHLLQSTHQQSVTKKEFIELNLQGSQDAVFKRKRLSHMLHLGSPNAKTMYKRLNMIGLTKRDIEDIL